MHVVEATSGQPLQPGTVYVAPGDHHLEVRRAGAGLQTHLQQGPAENFCRPAVDVLFRSVAAAVGPAALGLVMTGMGSDGRRGSDDLVRGGARVVVQDAATSVVWGMPGSVAQAGLADAVLPLTELAPEVLRRLGVAAARPDAALAGCALMPLAAQSFSFVQDLVLRESAIVLGPGKEYLVESRLGPLAQADGSRDLDAWIDGVRRFPTGPAGRALVEALTTNETSFFRDVDPFTHLRDQVLPTLAKARGGSRRLRIWCGACSSGQEPYSVAMTVADSPAVAGWHTEIVGTDLSRAMLERCRTGRYSRLEVNRGLPATSLVKHFVRDGAGWQVSPALKAMARFSELNLMRPLPPMGRFDVVFLRNVLIYFDVQTKQAVLRRVADVLAPDGYLYLGAAETTLGLTGWERVPAGRGSVYRKVS
ncbi:hypothetical protein GCM10025868_41700 [Angustibacter aerolatus]|uniref:protein-glutamate O-methyltransferase n=1 Tax=Angustibacter aerolatus TaxID=1162965 RepID=A0ABQ6JKY3_9ACTN|nr:hypothetical protein GCM10025868_41700 [Angustibacter aerolatus]